MLFDLYRKQKNWVFLFFFFASFKLKKKTQPTKQKKSLYIWFLSCVLPDPHRVIDHGEANRMTTQSVAIVFGPTLLRPETETGNIAVHMVYQNQIVELILIEYESIFER